MSHLYIVSVAFLIVAGLASVYAMDFLHISALEIFTFSVFAVFAVVATRSLIYSLLARFA